MPSINQLRLGPDWQTSTAQTTAGGLSVTSTPSAITFDFGGGGAGVEFAQLANAWNATSPYDSSVIGTNGRWDIGSGDLVWHNASFPDFGFVDPAAVPFGQVRFGVVLYNIQNFEVGYWEIDWGVSAVYDALGGLLRSQAFAYLQNETGQYSLIDPAINGGGSNAENFGGTTGPTNIPTPVEMYRWMRLRSAGGLIFLESSRDGTTWAYVHGSGGGVPDLGGNSMPMSALMTAALRTVGVQFYVIRAPGYGSGTWTIDNLNTAPYPTGTGDPTSDSVWVSYGFNDAGQTGRGEFGPTGTYLGTDEPTPKQVLFPNDVDIVQLAVGSNQAAAITADAHIYVWGDCLLGEGQGLFGDQLVPPFGFDPSLGDPPQSQRAIAVPTLLAYAEASDVQQIALGATALFWVRSDHTVWGVGLNAAGEFGTGSSGEYFGAPHQLAVGVEVSWLASCLFVPGLFCVGTDGLAHFAGDNSNGMSGSGGAGSPQLTFVAVPTVTDVSQLSADGVTALAIAQYGSVWIWGVDLTNSSLLVTAPIALLGAASSLFAMPFTTVSAPPTPGAWGNPAPGNTSLAITKIMTLEPPLPESPPDPGTLPIPVS